jgi:hypothetical protein
MKGQRGIALILALLVTSFLSAVGLGLAVVVFMDRLATGNVKGSVALLYAADAGIELAAHDVARADWSAILDGTEQAGFADGSPNGIRAIPGGGAVDLSAETNTLNCGRTTACTAAQMNANSAQRPWGPNNPRWRLYAYGPLENISAIARPAPCYLAVWVADDSREQDGDPLRDGDDQGRGLLRVRATAYGPLGSRQAIEAELAKVCFATGGEEICQPGLRVQSWQEVRQLLP